MNKETSKEQMMFLATARPTRAQLSGLTGDGIPVVEKLYTKMWEAIKSELRHIDQSTFGPEVGVLAGNICKTPMCIGGHTVNLAGEAGYALRHKVGFTIAARMIHIASSDLPEPRYDNYPNEWALAYIEIAAEKESAASIR